MHIIIKRTPCFCCVSIDNEVGRCDKDARKDVLKETVKETNIGNQIVPHKGNFEVKESIVKTGIKQHQYTGSFV